MNFTENKLEQAAMRKTIKRLLRKYKYPPKGQKKAMDTVLRQAKLMREQMVG
ncbi:MAG: hypothetical protein B6227_04810 [Fusobacteriia bacterium 4572_74]|nr:MAG: hypothetical protein B6227_04810 [Fusobacteriia bacterium 4572_74]